MRPLFIGLISGTSMDGVDAALVDCSGPEPRLAATHKGEYSEELAARLRAAAQSKGECELAEAAALDAEVAAAFAETALALQGGAGCDADQIEAIGSHGQTLWHAPDAHPPHTVQIGSPARVAALSGMVTVGDFRAADMALGGQGAPLAPVFHQWLFGRSGETRAVVNIGGIANLSVLAGDGGVTGYDTGPGNTLLDSWARTCRGEAYDENGQWARSGQVNAGLLERLLSDDFFSAPAPKSTGPELFNLHWLERAGISDKAPEDVQATLLDLTAASIAGAVRVSCAGAALAVCGGGASNSFLMERLTANCPESSPVTTEAWGVHPDWVEAAGFALLARARLRREPGNEPAVTGASRALPLGGVFLPSPNHPGAPDARIGRP
ncbi:MAG: anhydro-N-acetylmuramic acid kinase [Gammaproteobacteria bacterium]|nr:anhydro-N-acetylmuramic acid kinase [Gammaproteobacteria bacterium]